MMEATSPDLKIEPFDPRHNRAGFACGVESLDRYFRTEANQDMRRKVNGVFVLIDPYRISDNEQKKRLPFFCTITGDKRHEAVPDSRGQQV